MPDDDEYEGLEGRTVHFSVTVNTIETVELPELDDDFAAKVTEDDDEPLTLEQLRERIRDQLHEESERRAQSEYANKVLDEIVEQSSIAYPEVMVADQIDQMIKEFEQRLQQQGITLDNYLKISDMERDDLEEQYHDPAIRTLERSLVLREIVAAENLEVSDDRIEAHIDGMVAQFGDQAASFRQFFDTPQMRDSIVNDLLTQKVMDFVRYIGQGLDPQEELAKAEAEAQEAQSEAADDTQEAEVVEAEAEVVADDDED